MSAKLYRRSVTLVDQLERSPHLIVALWLAGASLASIIRLIVSSFYTLPFQQSMGVALPYALVIGAPAVSFLLALTWFRDGDNFEQPTTRLAKLGRWEPLSRPAAQKLPFYGVTGFMASLLLGLLLNIPMRALEFLTAIPALTATQFAWFNMLFGLMLLDVVLFTSLYAICFVAALRRVPLFPRLLVAIWAMDVAMQLAVGQLMTFQAGMPDAVRAGLDDLLTGNIKKVLISALIWTPYLLMSKRVNATFRLRRPA